MRKTLTKEITFTIVTAANMQLVEGKPTAVPLPTEKLLGTHTLEKIQRNIRKTEPTVTVLSVEHITETYEMDIEMFLQHATTKKKGSKCL